jgi:hypothetical protein
MIVPGDVLLLEAGDYIAAGLLWNEVINVEFVNPSSPVKLWLSPNSSGIDRMRALL